MKLMLPFLVSAAIAWPVDIPAQETPAPTRIQERVEHAIVPTTAGQIGINPPQGDPVFVLLFCLFPAYLLAYAVHEACANGPFSETGGDYNPFFTNYVDSSGKWTASNKDMITQVQVTTKDNKPTTTTVTAPVAVVTGPSDTLDILIAPAFNQKIGSMIKDIPVCTKKRSDSCGVLRLLEVFNDDNSAEIKAFKSLVKDIKFLSREALEATFKSMTTGVTQAQFLTALGEGAGAAPIMFSAWFLYHEASSLPSRFKFKNPPKNNLPTTEAPPKNDEPEKCTKDDKGNNAPACPDCDGKDNICQKGDYKHCRCLTVGTPIVYELSQEWLDGQIKAITDALAQADDKPDVTCPKGGYDASISVDQSFVNKLAEKFCADKFDSTKEHSRTFANADISSDAYKKYTFDFTYSPGNSKDKKCTTSCIDSIKAITSKCMGLTSHDVAPNGDANLACGAKYGYKINVPNKPKDADIKCSSKDYSQAIPIDNKFFNSMSDKFCKSLSGDTKKYLKNSDIGSTAYNGYTFHFESNLNKDCQPDCATVLKNMGSTCQGQDSHSMQASGTASFSCGASYSYHILKEDNPATASDKIGEVHCFGKDEFKHGPVDADTQGSLITWVWGNVNLEPDDKFNPWMDERSLPRGYQVKMKGTEYSYTVEWIKGCKGPRVDPTNPLKIKTGVGYLTGLGELLGLDENGMTTVDGGHGLVCPYNDRAGGWRNAGCLRYTFKPQWNDKLAKRYWAKDDHPSQRY